MKRLFVPIILLLFLSLLSLSACTAGKPVKVSRQEIAVTLDPERHALFGETSLELAGGMGTTLTLYLHPGIRLEKIGVNGQAISFRRSGEKIMVSLPQSDGAGARTVQVSYHAVFNDPAPERPVSTEDPTYGVSGAITLRGTYLGSDAGWYPIPESAPATRLTKISAPAGYEAITAGRRIDRRTLGDITTSAWEEKHPVEKLSLSAGPYVIAEARSGSLPIYTYFYPENAALAEQYLEACARYIPLYADLFGPYPFEKFAVVENFFPTGYGFPSYTLLGGSVIRLPFILTSSLPHEIAHCWWGNGVLVDTGEGNWSEGLATYLADHLMEERKSAHSSRDYRFRILSDYSSLVQPSTDFPLRQFGSRFDQTSRSIGYGKSAMVFHMVRRQIGDDAFFAALRNIVKDRIYSTASWSDFSRAFSATAGRDLAPFIWQWLSETGGPRLAFSGVQLRKGDREWKVSGTLVQTGKGYSLSVPLRLEGGGERKEMTVQTTGGQTEFSLSLPVRPELLAIDPDTHIFRLLSPAELPATVNRVKGSRSLVAVVSNGWKGSQATIPLLLRSLGQGGVDVRSEAEVTPATMAGHDLLVFGIPERSDLLQSLSPEVSFDTAGFSVEKERFSTPDDALFVVTSPQATPERVIGLFHPLSARAGEACALKITHYGKYGLLAFSGGENRQKRVTAPSGGEGVVLFGKSP